MWQELTRGLYEFLTELQLEEQIHQAQEAFEEAGEELLASQYRQIYKIVVDLLDKLVVCWEKKYFPSGIMQMFWKKGLRRQKSVRFRREQTV